MQKSRKRQNKKKKVVKKVPPKEEYLFTYNLKKRHNTKDLMSDLISIEKEIGLDVKNPED